MTADELRRLDRTAFVAAFGGVFEHSPWVAEAAFAAYPDRDALHAGMVAAMQRAPRERQLALIRAHPELAGRVQMAPASASEQAGAGLDRCTPEEYQRFQDLNEAYKERFGFPYILAVKGKGRAEILADFASRLDNDPQTEFNRALDEIARIARFRLNDLVLP